MLKHYKIIIISFLFLVIYFNNDYTNFKKEKFTVLDKVYTHGGYKSTDYFYLIVKSDNQEVCTIDVFPHTYLTSKIGSTYYFMIRDYDIRENTKDTIIFVWIEVILGSIIIAYIVLCLIYRRLLVI